MYAQFRSHLALKPNLDGMPLGILWDRLVFRMPAYVRLIRGCRGTRRELLWACRRELVKDHHLKFVMTLTANDIGEA
jgi:hypothetical protein